MADYHSFNIHKGLDWKRWFCLKHDNNNTIGIIYFMLGMKIIFRIKSSQNIFLMVVIGSLKRTHCNLGKISLNHIRPPWYQSLINHSQTAWRLNLIQTYLTIFDGRLEILILVLSERICSKSFLYECDFNFCTCVSYFSANFIVLFDWNFYVSLQILFVLLTIGIITNGVFLLCDKSEMLTTYSTISGGLLFVDKAEMLTSGLKISVLRLVVGGILISPLVMLRLSMLLLHTHAHSITVLIVTLWLPVGCTGCWGVGVKLPSVGLNVFFIISCFIWFHYTVFQKKMNAITQ